MQIVGTDPFQEDITAGPNTGTVTYDAAAGYADTDGYDHVGNRGKRTVSLSPSVSGLNTATYSTYDANDRLGSIQSTKVGASFDANGNTTQIDLDANGTGDFAATDQYDFENRLIQASRPGGTVTIVYDGDGHRARKTVDGTTTYYLVDDLNPSGYAQVIEERSSPTSDPLVKYVYGLDLISQTRGATTHHYGYDGLGSVRYLAREGSGTISDTYTYDAFGVLIAQTPTTGRTPNNYRYTGEQWDEELGQYYLRGRYYQPSFGRFWTTDLFEGTYEDPLSLHKYLYCYSDPVNGVDPSGHDLIGLMVNIYVKAQIGAFTAVATYGALAETTLMVTALGYVTTYQQLSTGLDENGEPLTTFSAAMLYVGIIGDLVPVGKIVRVGTGSIIRKVILKPTTPGWGLTAKHLKKHFFGEGATSLKAIDPKGNADKWAQHLAELFNAPVTKKTGGMLDIIMEFPKAEGGGTFKMGIRLCEKSDGTFDLVTVLTDQSKM